MAKLTGYAFNTRVNIPLVLVMSVIPDIDLVFHFVRHRGPFHSIVLATAFFVPVFFMWRKASLPYLVALLQHSLLGDFFIGGKTQLLWPLTPEIYGTDISITSPISITLEWLLFITATLVMLKTRDVRTFFRPNNSNLILVIPMLALLVPMFLLSPSPIPVALMPPHVVYLALFAISLMVDLSKRRLNLNSLRGLHKKVY